MENREVCPFFQNKIGLTQLYQTYSMFVVRMTGLEPAWFPT